MRKIPDITQVRQNPLFFIPGGTIKTRVTRYYMTFLVV